MKKPPADDEDRQLWQRVAKSVTPYDRRRSRITAGKKAAPKNSSPAKPAAAKAGALAPARTTKPAAPKAAPVPAQKPAAGFDRATAEKMRRGKLEIDGRIDLHGLREAAAHTALKKFIARARAAGWRTLLVITGKGRVSEGGGVIRRQLPIWLADEAAVLTHMPAQPKDGGSGAFYVRLRK